MIARCGPLFAGNEAAMITIACVGGFTAIFAATIALRQFDLKKVFAYSTVSQLGFMFVGVAVLAPVAGVFHLVTHAFFKALLFLSSGVVMHAMLGVLDLREMSGLKRVLPVTRWLMLIGCLALAGMVPFSGFFSKDEIIHAALERGGIQTIVGIVLLVTAFLTAYYTFRLYFRVFEGPLREPAAPAAGHGGHGHGGHDDHATASASAVQAGDAHESGVDEHLASKAHQHALDDHGHHNHEPLIMIAPLVLLAIGALAAGFLNWPSEGLGHFLGQSRSFQLAFEVAKATHPAPLVTEGTEGAAPEGIAAAGFGQHEANAAEHEPFNIVMLVSFAIATLGILLAYALHLRDRARAERLAAGLPKLTGLLEAKYWVDEIYQNTIVEPLRGLGRVLFDADRYLVDGFVAAVGWVPQLGGWVLKLGVQRGSLQGYAAAMLFGVLFILLLVYM
jgi:NADH-quinone oxidoreductase subunit L